VIGPTATGQTGRRLRRNAPRLLALAGIVLFLGLLAYGVTTEGESTRVDESLASGQAPLAPSFDLPILESGEPPAPLNRKLQAAFADGQLALSELDGTPFVLNFWASWCIPCREEAPTLQQGWERLGPKGILILGLNMQDLTDDARGFLEEFGITYPTIREPGNETARAYGATGIPETYFVSPEGRVVGHAIGVVSRRQLADGALSAKLGEVVGTVAGGASWPQR
jgi:cytochrome c biogenesis protein CcmG/thiol:disulfide interchange protein DsbE